MSSAFQVYEVDSVRIRVTRKQTEGDAFDDRVQETISIEARDAEGNELAHISLTNNDPQPQIVVTFDDER